VASTAKEEPMLSDARVEATVPTEDLAIARRFYEETLGLRASPGEARGIDVVYACGAGTVLRVYERGAPELPPRHTLAHFVVDDVPATVVELRGRGVVFEDYALPELQTVDGVATVDGHRIAWFRDADGNILGLHD
jgi:catechol 2,3-dioxygenase-like lactoylglutathione lyase family enzyme